MTIEVHYVATLKVERVERITVQPITSGRPGSPEAAVDVRDRSIQTVTNLTLRADQLVNLTKKLNAHIALIDED